MKQITNKQYEEYQQFLKDKTQGKILTPEGLQFICEANECNAEEIGRVIIANYLKHKERY